MAHPSAQDRQRRICQLLDRLEAAVESTPAELFRNARLIAGWSIIRGPYQGWTVCAPSRGGQHLRRDAVLALLLAEWVPQARAELATPAPIASVRERWVAREDHNRIVAVLRAELLAAQAGLRPVLAYDVAEAVTELLGAALQARHTLVHALEDVLDEMDSTTTPEEHVSVVRLDAAIAGLRPAR